MKNYIIELDNENTAPSTTETSPTSTTPSISITPGTVPVPAVQQATDNPPAQITSTAALPDGYLSKGYYQGEGKGRYIDPALVDQAEAIGTSLAKAGVSPSTVNRMVRTLKAAAKLPYAAQQGALKKLTPIVLDLEHKKKAPPMLREMVERNQAAVNDGADYAACLDHMRDVSIYLTAAQS